MSADEKPLCEAFVKIAVLGNALGVAPLNAHPGCWEYRLDEQWEIAVNGHREPTQCSHGVAVEPFHCYVQYNGWPAGLINPSGGTFVAGSCANEDEFIAALEREISAHPRAEA